MAVKIISIIEIEPLENGAHRNQRGRIRTIPEGWIEIPATVQKPSSFPFVDLIIENGVLTGMTAKDIPTEE